STANYQGRTFRIGAPDSPPYTFFSNGKACGFAVDILEAAAQRVGVHLEWIGTSETPDQALPRRAVDLWPVVGITPERRKRMYITSSWLNLSFCLVSLKRANLITPGGVRGKTVAFSGFPMATQAAKA